MGDSEPGVWNVAKSIAIHDVFSAAMALWRNGHFGIQSDEGHEDAVLALAEKFLSACFRAEEVERG